MSDSPLWQALLKAALETEEYEIGCKECFDLLDMYADQLLDGANPAELLPTVKQHLKQCNCCDRELEALMVMLKDAAAQPDE